MSSSFVAHDTAVEVLANYTQSEDLYLINVAYSTTVVTEELVFVDSIITKNPNAKLHCSVKGVRLTAAEKRPISRDEAILLYELGCASIAPDSGEWLECYYLENTAAQPIDATDKVNFLIAINN